MSTTDQHNTPAPPSEFANHPQRMVGVEEVSVLLGLTVENLYDRIQGVGDLMDSAIRLGRSYKWQLCFVLDWIADKQQAALNHQRGLQAHRDSLSSVTRFHAKRAGKSKELLAMEQELRDCRKEQPRHHPRKAARRASPGAPSERPA